LATGKRARRPRSRREPPPPPPPPPQAISEAASPEATSIDDTESLSLTSPFPTSTASGTPTPAAPPINPTPLIKLVGGQEQGRKRRKIGGGGDILTGIDKIITVMREGQSTPYERALEILFKEYKEEDTTWRMSAAKALKHDSFSEYFVAAPKEERATFLGLIMESNS
jgi:hypothetical protein